MIDFSDVLDDEELGAQSLYLVRIDAVVGTNGRSTPIETMSTITGNVTQDAGAIMERTDAATYVKGSILVTTATALREAGAGVDADVIIWNGKRYVVSVLSDYTLHGFNWAVCVPEGIQA